MKAVLNNYRQSPRKMRLVSDLVKGKSVEEALRILSVTTKAASLPFQKLLRSAARNAKNISNADEKNLLIKSFSVNAGPTLKRHIPRARGSAYPIRKRTSTVTLILSEQNK